MRSYEAFRSLGHRRETAAKTSLSQESYFGQSQRISTTLVRAGRLLLLANEPLLHHASFGRRRRGRPATAAKSWAHGVAASTSAKTSRSFRGSARCFLRGSYSSLTQRTSRISPSASSSPVTSPSPNEQQPVLK